MVGCWLLSLFSFSVLLLLSTPTLFFFSRWPILDARARARLCWQTKKTLACDRGPTTSINSKLLSRYQFQILVLLYFSFTPTPIKERHIYIFIVMRERLCV